MTLGEVGSWPLIIGWLGFGATAIAYLILAVLVLSSHPGTRQASWLVAALLTTAAWGAVTLVGIWTGALLPGTIPGLDALHIVVWVVFLAALMRGSTDSQLSIRLGRTIIIAAVSLAVIAVAAGWYAIGATSQSSSAVALVATLSLPVVGLLALEQVFRNARFPEHAFLKPLSLALGAVLAVDVFLYSQAVLFSTVSASAWPLQGVMNAAVAPVLLIAIKRQPNWGKELYISRQAIFYTTGLIGAGLYLLAMGTFGFVLGTGRGAWAAPVQLAFLICAAGIFAYALFSSELRRHFKIFISKHFFKERYDYRTEWLRLTRALAEHDRETSLAERSLNALTAIISSPGGELWLSQATPTGFDQHAVSSASGLSPFLPVDDEMVQFLKETFWVVDTREFAAGPEKYAYAFTPGSPWLKTESIVVPLIHERRLVGIVRLDRPALIGSLDFKDHDLLKTAGQQVAVFLVQERSQELLSETRQFEAFSKLTTFLMHDLKNLIAQQELVVGNARRFRHRPEFIDDAINTIEGSVKRMRGLLERLQGVTRERSVRIDLGKLVREACQACGDRQPSPKYAGGVEAFVIMDRDKLNMMLTHAIRNSQDATPAEGRIDVRVSKQGMLAVIEVEDTGAGMDAEFIRDELFKPFSSTKGAQGMGIGAYQIRETARSVGGDVEVTSQVGKGTLLRMKIPISETAGGLSRRSVAGGVS